MPDQTRSLPNQLRQARLLPTSFNPETRTIDVVWTTGARVRRYNWWENEYYDEELSLDGDAVDMTRLGSGTAPVVDSHRVYGGLEAQIGVVERAWIANGEGLATLRLSQRSDLAGIVEDIRTGIIRNISVGYSVQRYQIDQGAGEVPVYRAVEWMPHEISFVTVPADAGAMSRSAENSTQGTPCVFARAAARNNPQETHMPTANPVAAATRAADEAVTSTPAAAATAATTTAANATATETPESNDAATRAADIVELATRHGFGDRSATWLREGRTVDQVRKLILDEQATRDQQSGGNLNRVSAGEDEREKFRGAASHSLLARAMLVDHTTGKRFRADGDNPCRGLTLLELARFSLERIGVRTHGMNKLELVGRAFTQSGSDFPILLETAMHKSLQAAYALAPDTWSRFCKKGTVGDFRSHTRYRVGSIGNLDALTELGEFKNKRIPDGEKASISAGTKGNIINLSRQAIVNDDLDAFLGLAAQLGRTGKRTVEADVYAYLASNPTMPDTYALFSAEHGNLESAGAPTVTTVDSARVKLASQHDVGANDPLDLTPAIWLGPKSYGSAARVINAAEYDPDTANKLQRPNAVRGLFRDVVDTARITDTKWYLFADPADAPVIEVVFLDGEEEPFLEMEEGFTVDGARWKVRLDFGVGAIDYRGAVRNG